MSVELKSVGGIESVTLRKVSRCLYYLLCTNNQSSKETRQSEECTMMSARYILPPYSTPPAAKERLC
jgi:hypothetical protein